MDSVFVWVESSTFSIWTRESTSVFAFPTFLAVHAIGMALVAGMGAHMPSVGAARSLGMEIVLTFFLMFVVAAVSINQRRVRSFSGLAIGGTVVFGVLLGGPISGGSMNPARAFGPALIGSIWTDHWVYWVGPLLGASLGALTYLILIRMSSK